MTIQRFHLCILVVAVLCQEKDVSAAPLPPASARLGGSTLNIVYGPAGDPAVTLTGVGLGEIVVTGTDVGGGYYSGVKNIRVVGSDNGDWLNLIDVHIVGNVSADLKDGGVFGGYDYLRLQGDIDIGGNCDVKSRGSDAEVYFSLWSLGDPMRVGKNLSVDLGSGHYANCYVSGHNPGEVLTVGGNVTIRGKANSQYVEMDSIDVGKNLSIDLGDDADLVEIGVYMDDPDLSVSVGGNATIRTGNGVDEVCFLDGNAGSVLVGRNLNVDLENADAGIDWFRAEASNAGENILLVGGNFTIQGKSGMQGVQLENINVIGNLVASLGNDSDGFLIRQSGLYLGPHVVGDFRLDGGNGIDLGSFDPDVIVLGETRIRSIEGP